MSRSEQTSQKIATDTDWRGSVLACLNSTFANRHTWMPIVTQPHRSSSLTLRHGNFDRALKDSTIHGRHYATQGFDGYLRVFLQMNTPLRASRS